jgi:ABC-2 type transport system permease protein
MQNIKRHLRLYLALCRYSLAREMAFRGNFLAKVSVEVLWLFILLGFYRTVFTKTSNVATWSESEYLFFVGCYFALAGVIESLFLYNCNEFADLVRTGDLDFYLLKPMDEQFLVTCREIDWCALANVVMGTAIMALGLAGLGWTFDLVRLIVFLILCVGGIAITYSCLVFLTALSVWLKRNQSLYEIWWLFSSLMRYPREIFYGPWASPLGMFFTFIVPILLVVNVPANVLVRRAFDPGMVAFTVVAAVVLLATSRWFFRHALRRYRSASS